jgi:hypothetical protein
MGDAQRRDCWYDSERMSFSVPAGLKAFPDDPNSWKEEINMRVQTELAIPTERIKTWQDLVNTNNPDFEPDFNPVDKVNDALSIRLASSAGQQQLILLVTLKEEEQDKLQQQFEQSWLYAWANTQAFNVFKGLSQFAWGRVQDRLVAYGERIGLSNFGSELRAILNKGVAEYNQKRRSLLDGLIIPPL